VCRGRRFRASLSEEDRGRIDPPITLYFDALKQQLQFQRDGVVNPEEWRFQVEGMTFVANQPGFREPWQEFWGPVPGEELRKILDGLIRENETAG